MRGLPAPRAGADDRDRAPAGEEIQWDWLELHETPWGEPAFVLVGALSHSGRFRAVFCEQMTFGHLAEAHRCCVGLGGTSRVWRTDRMATVVVPGTDRLTVDAAKSPSTTASRSRSVRRGGAQRKGVVEKAIQFTTGSWWRTARIASRRGAGRAWIARRRGRRPARRGRTVRSVKPAPRSRCGAAGARLPGGDHRRSGVVALGAGRV